MLAAYFVWQQVGVYTLSGVGLYILLLPINMLLGKVCAQRETERERERDRERERQRERERERERQTERERQKERERVCV